MIHHLSGRFVELTPTHMVVECAGVGYMVHISLHTSSALAGQTEGKVLIHAVYREDAQLLFGFSGATERSLFVMLTSVSGVGAQTARMILSGLGPAELVEVISRGDVNALKAVKGIGAKTAQRILVDLQDKMGKDPSFSAMPASGISGGEGKEMKAGGNTQRSDALGALCNLGFDRKRVENVLDQLLAEGIETVEEMVRAALKRL
ncbi:MAG: Holliday junction branch migration protein RuvA [Flavobacteriales bacterium]|nr:Holliday junction branch migration protein RuvA [Flavobacteriales bacterium]